MIARFFAPYLSAQLGQPVVVENRPGGSTSIGTKLVASSEADGYTLLFSNTPTHVIAALGNASISYDPLQDFAPIAAIASSSLVLVIAPAIPARSVPELVGYAKAHPGKLNFGFGQGTLPHLAGELFKAVTGTDIVSIPYRGGSQAISDLLGGRIHMNFGAGSTLLPLIREGKLRPLAVTSPTRRPEQPEVPTMIEAGLPDVTVVTHYGMLAPASTPPQVVATLNTAVNQALRSSDHQGRHVSDRVRAGRWIGAGFCGIARRGPAEMGADRENDQFSNRMRAVRPLSFSPSILPRGLHRITF